MITFLLDPGHGENTPGKRSPFIPPGIKEYEFNRDIVKRICYKATLFESFTVKSLIYIPERVSLSLKKRVKRANDYYKVDKDCVFVSIHANAFGDGKEWVNGVSGCTTFTSYNCSIESIRLASMLRGQISKYGCFIDRGNRDSNLYVLKHTKMPAVLVESGFMTHSDDATKLANDYWRDQIATGYIEAFNTFVNKR